MREPGERLYLYDDASLGVRGCKDPDVTGRHVARYLKAINDAGRTGGVWVDFACGSGYGTNLISDVANFTVGMDRDELAIDYARSWHGGDGRIYHVADHKSCWELLAQWQLQPDVIVSVETIEHMDVLDQIEWVRAAGEHLGPRGVFVLQCPIGSGPSEVNPWHLYEPSEAELDHLLHEHFRSVTIEMEEYVSTAGVTATQAFAVCRAPAQAGAALAS